MEQRCARGTAFATPRDGRGAPTYAVSYHKVAVAQEQTSEAEKARAASGKALAMNAAKSLIATVAPVVLAGCVSLYDVSIETPVRPAFDASPFQRVLVAGFLTGGTREVDLNLETTRLLRSQLRRRSALRVLDAELMPLADIAAGDDGRTGRTLGVPAPPGAANQNKRDLLEQVFADAALWRTIGDEYLQPLIVTGTVSLVLHDGVARIRREDDTFDAFGRRASRPVQRPEPITRFALTAKFIFIDGRTGAPIYTEALREEVRYPALQSVPALSSYFELMDRVIPGLLASFTDQPLRQRRLLLK